MKRDLAPLLLLALLLVVQAAVYAPRMPDPMATHFGLSGEADGWMSPVTFFSAMGFVSLLTVGLLVVVAVFLPRLPIEMISIPNREHWLTGERRGESFEVLRRYVLALGLATALLTLGATQSAIDANLRPPPARLDGWFLWLLGAYLAFTVLWVVSLWRRFATEPDVPAETGYLGCSGSRASDRP